ncbi:hypothetical protein [Streptomyces cyaneofuscatus]|uniref:hypothetical protein n=1 Tax=Streptomyces cyaneofuscatus TaxID=66883 RepID=UPI003648EE13
MAATSRKGLLGGYDGADAWSPALSNLRSADEQLMVETHEVFATTLSASPAGVRRARSLLDGNTMYSGSLERGPGPAGVGVLPWRFRETAVAAVLRCAMAPAEVRDILETGFARVRRTDVPETARPDRRLEAFEATGGPGGWEAVLSELVFDHPDRGIDRGDADRRGLPDGEAPDSLRRFEEEVVLRRCYAYVSAVLADAGMPSVAWEEQAVVGNALEAAVAEVDGELSERLNVVTERRPVLEDGLEYDRQKIVLRQRLPVELVDGAQVPEFLDAFVVGDQDRDRDVCGVWLSREVARKQFDFPEGTELPEPVIALPALVRTADGRQVVRLLTAAFTVDRQSAFRFLSVGGKAGVSVLTRRLRRRHGGGGGGHVEIDGAFLQDDAAGFKLVLDQDTAS